MKTLKIRPLSLFAALLFGLGLSGCSDGGGPDQDARIPDVTAEFRDGAEEAPDAPGDPDAEEAPDDADAAEALDAETPDGEGKKFHPGHYMLTSRDAPQSTFDIVFDEPNLKGVLVRYFWRDLEPEEGVYDLSRIRSDLEYLRDNAPPDQPKRLSAMIMDRIFQEITCPVPDYMTEDPDRFDTGWFYRDTGTSATCSYAKIWVPGVTDRLIALYEAVAAEFDAEPLFEHVYTEETALGAPDAWRNPDGSVIVGVEAPQDEILANLLDERIRHLRSVEDDFRSTVVLVSINFSWDAPGRDTLAELFQTAYETRFGTGNPDLRDYERNIDPFSDQYEGLMTLTTQVQVSAYSGETTIQSLFDYAVDELHYNHVYWLLADWAPIAPAEIIDVINANEGRINDGIPENIAP